MCGSKSEFFGWMLRFPEDVVWGGCGSEQWNGWRPRSWVNRLKLFTTPGLGEPEHRLPLILSSGKTWAVCYSVSIQLSLTKVDSRIHSEKVCTGLKYTENKADLFIPGAATLYWKCVRCILSKGHVSGRTVWLQLKFKTSDKAHGDKMLMRKTVNAWINPKVSFKKIIKIFSRNNFSLWCE